MWCCDTSGITPRDISLFIVEKGTEGFDIGQKIEDKVYVIYIKNSSSFGGQQQF